MPSPLALTKKEKIGLAVLAALIFIVVYYGWRLFWFLTDDAYIAFRYVSNSILGHGYVWNPAPFKPVEGYTSFLWVLLMDLIWRLFGVEPPVSANPAALLFAYLTLFIGALMVVKTQWNASNKKYRILLLGLALVGVVSNRTFLTWTSSGLETAMFNFFFTLWIFFGLFLPNTAFDISGHSTRQAKPPLWLPGINAAAILTYLTRPDGILMVAATICITLLYLYRQRGTRSWLKSGFFVTSLWLIIPLHLAWRKATYGEWLPNTYYAKTIPGRLWIESGSRYFLSFVMEYALWFWLLLAGAMCIYALFRLWKRTAGATVPSINRLIVLGTVLAHFLYYTIVIGGDHFEYRVYSHLILLIFISFLFLADRLHLNAGWTGLLLICFIAASWIIPWTHWDITHQVNTRQETKFLYRSVAEVVQQKWPGTPAFAIEYLQHYDNMQSWLIGHGVCMRHQEHKIFYEYLINVLPSRAYGLALPGDDYPIFSQQSIGVIAWVLPRVNIIDTLGLNDYVIAHNPDTNPGIMAHERKAPEGYVECFAPNVQIAADRQIIITPRDTPLTAKKIQECERTFAELVNASK